MKSTRESTTMSSRILDETTLLVEENKLGALKVRLEQESFFLFESRDGKILNVAVKGLTVATKFISGVRRNRTSVRLLWSFGPVSAVVKPNPLSNSSLEMICHYRGVRPERAEISSVTRSSWVLRA
jgi:hypothetical protein